MPDPARTRLDRLWHAVTRSPGALPPDVRLSLAEQGPAPEGLAAYVDMVRRSAYRVTDADIARLQQAGYDDEQIFEATVATAVGAGFLRLNAGLAALEGAT
ncbi:MAG: hypothetical protein H7338_04750 [Candidatus Sericytochromatia bacterium]|nr:hypothetical protein [Candidatus Sericytochromatia bacterium]